MQIFPTKTFEINFREAGSNSYFTAKCGHEVYTRKSLASLMFFLRDKGHDFVVLPRK